MSGWVEKSDGIVILKCPDTDSSQLTDFMNRDGWDGPYMVVECRKALSPSRLPGIDYALNPYSGCSHGCVYCYAPEVTHSDWKGWRIPRVRQNIATRLSKEIGPLNGVIGIGTSTDPYQYAEKRFELTRQCLEVISHKGMSVNIMTKSDLFLRDSDLLSGMRHAIGVTITHIDDAVSKRTEPGAPLPSVRLSAMKDAVDNGLAVYGLIGPIMSTVKGSEESIVEAVISTGVTAVCLDRLNMRPLLGERLQRMGISTSDDSVNRMRSLFVAAGLDVADAFGEGWHEQLLGRA